MLLAGIKFGAHPLVVAVAMGLLGPSVLADESSAGERLPSDASRPEPEPEPVSAEEFARVEGLWHEVRVLG